MDIRQKEIDRILDFNDGEDVLNDDEMLALLDTEEGQLAWRDIQDLDEAANRLMGKQPDVDAAWEKFTRRHPTKETVKTAPRRSVMMRIWKPLIAVAAVVSLIFVISYNKAEIEQRETKVLSLQMTDEEVVQNETIAEAKAYMAKEKVKTITVTVPAGETKDVTLPDGTEVCLNAKSTLSYPEKFQGKERRVVLLGEGYFKVSHDEKHPFLIHTLDLTTRVLGTEFNVRCYDVDDAHVTLVNGSVEVASNINKVKISPNQDACLAEGKLVVANVNPKDFTSWREGLMYFDNATLLTILHQIGAWYNMSVVCHDVPALDKHFHYMFFKDESLDEALRLLTESSDIDIKVDGNTIIVK